MRSRHVLNVIFAFLFASFSAFAASDLGLISLTGNTPERVIANPVTNKFYVTTVSGSLYEIDGSSLQALALSTGGTTINGYESIALDVASNRVFAVSTTGSTNDKFVLFDRNTNSFTSIKDYGTTEDPSSVLVNPSNGKIFVGYYNSTSTACAVDVFDAGLGAPVTRVLGGTTAETVRGMALNLVNNKVYVITTTKVFELDGTTGVIGNSATGLTNLHDVVFNPVSSKIYVSDNATDTVSIYNTSLGLITSVSVGDRAAALSVNTNANVVFVSNFGTNSPGFCMIDGASNAVTPFNVPGTFQYSGFTINHVTNEVYLVSAQEGVEIRNGSNGNVIRTLSSIGRKGSSINPVTNRLAVAESGGVRILDVSTHAASTIAAGTGPSALAVNRATNRVHVVNTGDNTVTIRNCDAAHSLVGTANVGTQPVAIAINEATGNVYVVNKGSNTVSVYNESAPGTVATINVGNTPVAVAVNTVTNKAYVVNQSNGSLDGSISVIDGATNTVRKTVTIGKKPEAIIVNAIRNRIFAISSNDDKLWVLEGGTDEFPTNLPGGSVTVGSQPMALAQSTQNERVFTANQLGNNITIVDGVDFTNNGNTGIGTPRAIIYNPNNDSIYVGLQSNDIVRASASNLISQNTINVGASTTALALDVNSNRLYAAASNGSLNIIQCATNTSTSISVGSQTPAIAVNPLAGTVYAVNSGSNDLTVLDMQNEVPRNMTVTASLTTPATNNIVFTQTPSISFSVSSSLIAGINPTRVYYQVDSTKGRWNSVTLSGGGPFTASDILPTQTDGTHILYCFAVDGQHVVNDDGFGADDTNGNSPNIGPISTLTFTVQNNNQPTLDPLNNGQQLTIREDVFTSNFSTVSLTGISAGNANEGAQVLSLSANLIQNQDAVINATTVEIINFSGSTATLRFKTTQDAFNTPGRKATIRVTLNDNGAGRYDGPKTIVRDLDIVVIPANDPPVVVSPPNNSVFNINEDAGTQTVNITGVDIGPSNEADTDGNGITEQFVQDIVAFSSDTSIIPHPVIDQHNPNLKTARMTYTPVANKSGTVTITLRVRDNGPDGGGFDVREANFTYTVNIAAVNDAPTVAPVADLTINEDAAQHTVSLTGITIGALEAGQTLTFAVASSNTALIPTPNLTDDGGGKATLTFTPVANTSGTSTITVTITDNGSGTAPNVNQIVETFDVIVNAVNDAPSFTKGPDFTVTEAGVQTSMANWATNFVFGPADEATQTVKQFNLTPDKPEF
ncbi:MAG TPA: Ig-like domain-containing protein, partial [Planctomycetota bacterium]|nr:Ig-like domain-containing protein [Planctomycetota bacterium]